MPVRAFGPLSLAACLIAPAIAAAQTQIQILAQEAWPPNPAATNFHGAFSNPIFAAGDDVVFGGSTNATASTGTGNPCIWRVTSTGTAATASIITAAGDPAPSATLANFQSFVRLNANRSGDVVLLANLAGLGVVDADAVGVYRTRQGVLEKVARAADEGPGVAPAVLGTSLGSQNLWFSARGDALVYSNYTGGYGYFCYPPQPPPWAVSTLNQAAPGVPAGTYSDMFTDDEHWSINASGTVAHLAYIRRPGIINFEDAVVVSTPAGSTLVAAEGQPAPGGAGTWNSFNLVTINDAGDVCFRGAGSVSLLCRSRNLGPIEIIARAGDPAPGVPNAVYAGGSNFGGSVALAGDGQAAFFAALSGPPITSSNNLGIFAGTPGNVRLLARTGDLAPGAGGARFTNFYAVTANAGARFAFGARLNTGSDGIWVTGCDGQFTLALLEGQSITMLDGVSRVIDEVYALNISDATSAGTGGAGGQDGRRRAFNDLGSVTAYVGVAGTSADLIVIARTPCAPPCRADFNGIGGVTVQDVFDFLVAYFAGLPSADINGVGGVTIQDVFDFLVAYFAGC